MKNMQKLIDVCQAYKAGGFGVEEFQHRLEAVCLPDQCKYTLEIDQYNAANDLEEILYCQSEEDHKQYADKVADELIEATILEQERLKDYRPYSR